MKKLFVGSILLLLILFVILLFPKSNPPDIIKFLVLSQLIFLVYLLICYIGKKIDFSHYKDKKLWLLVIGCALFLRVIIPLFSVDQTYLSDDVYRYIWEGKMVSHAYNPYIYSPNDFRNSGLTDETVYPFINHPWHVTIYPPLSQYLFVVSHIIGGDSIVGFKLLSVLFELLALFLIYRLINIFKLPDWTYLLYLFCPLILIEFLFSNHLDMLGLPFFVLILIMLKDTNPKSALIGILFALGVLVKLYLLFFLPFIFYHFKSKNRLYFSITFVCTIIIFYLPFIASSGFNVFGSLLPYLQTWQYNGSVFLLIKQITDQAIARNICYGLLMLSYIPIFTLKPFKNNLYLQMFAIFGLYLILTPSIFNWYLLWVIPFIILFRNYSFLLLTGTIFLSYHVLIGYYDNGIWTDYPVLRIITYVPFYIVLSIELYNLFKLKLNVKI